MSWLALDDAGWLYCGIGTARGNIVAYNTNTGEKRQIPAEVERTSRGGWVFPSVDGKVYGTVAGKNWRLHNGVGEVMSRHSAGASDRPASSAGRAGQGLSPTIASRLRQPRGRLDRHREPCHR